MKSKKILATLIASTLVVGSFIGCSGTDSKDKDGGDTASAKEIYFLNFKPEIAEVYDKIAKDYEEETGVKVKVQTAASNTYEQTLKSEMAKKDAPTIFQINGPIGYKNWKDYCADIKDTELYSHLIDKSLAVTDGDGVYGIPYAVEGYGIIYNDEIMQKYFALSNKGTDAKSIDDINNFDTLKAVVEDMQKHASDLGIEGVFASTSMSTGERWRWDTHLANIPLYYEFKDNTSGDAAVIDTALAADEVEFKYADEYKNIFDLYINNSCTEKGLLGSKSVNDSMADFALGKCAMVQNGNWAWAQINDVDGNKVSEDNIKFLPIYTGMKDEENQGLCIGTENYFAINSQASEAQQKAAEDFINWLFTSDKGKSYVLNDLGFIAPFDSFGENEKPSDPLSKEVLDWMNNKSDGTVNWTFQAFPSEQFKTTFSDALLEYVQGTQDWNYVKDTFIDTWKAEKAQ